MAFFLGIDGGGSKTTALITDDSLRVVGRGEAAGSNYHVVGEDAAVANISAAVSMARKKTPEPADIQAAAICLAGMRRPADFHRMQPRLEALGLAPSLVIDHDAAAAHHAALDGKPGVVVIAGTGSFAFGIDPQGGRFSAGGWGYLLGDEGGAYWCVVAALRLALRRHDRGEDSCAVGNAVILGLQCDDLMAAVDRVYHGGLTRDQIAGVAPELFRLAAAGDPDADWIVQEAARELASMAADVSRRCAGRQEVVTVSYQGSLLRESAALRKTFQTWMKFLASDAQVTPPCHESAVGAAGIARASVREPPHAG